jgi:hypothetical protein
MKPLDKPVIKNPFSISTNSYLLPKKVNISQSDEYVDLSKYSLSNLHMPNEEFTTNGEISYICFVIVIILIFTGCYFVYQYIKKPQVEQKSSEDTNEKV